LLTLYSESKNDDMTTTEKSARGSGEMTQHVEEACPPQKIPENLDEDPEFSYDDQRKIIHRVDKQLIIVLGCLHMVSLMDRSNISVALITGMEEGLDLVGFRYSIIALSFFPPYIVFQLFGPLLIRKIGPIAFLSGTSFFMGVVMMSGGFVKTWSEMVVIRVIIGAFEAGFFPGCVYLISTWYSRYDMQKRYAVFYILGCTASAFVGIVSYGIVHMDGLAGIAGWRWIFIIEGLFTCMLGFGSAFLLTDFPDRMKSSRRSFLTEREYDFILRRITRDRGDTDLEEFNWKKYMAAAWDVKPWAFGLIFFSTTTVAYAVSYFMPIILNKEMGFSIGVSLCLTAPPFVAAALLAYATSWFGDKYHLRGPVLVFNAILCFIGLPIMGFTQNTGLRLFGVFLTTMGPIANVPAAMAYQANNICGQWKRAVCSAVFVGLGGTGGMAGSLVFRSQDAPGYHPGLIACMACNGLLIIIVALLSLHFKRCNKKVDRGLIVLEGMPGFKYTY
ncbi:MFS general substrate transporter, partial [Penicillium sp. IBT 35674x]